MGNIGARNTVLKTTLFLRLLALASAVTDCVVTVPPEGSVSESLAATNRDVDLISDPTMTFGTSGTDCKATTSSDLVFNVFARYESGELLRNGYVSDVFGDTDDQKITLSPLDTDESTAPHAVYI